MQLYEKITTPAGRVSYREYTAPEPPATDPMTDAQLITMSVSVGVTCLMMLEKMLPPHARNARKIKAVETAIFELAKGQGQTVDPAMVDYWVDTWNRTMSEIQRGGA